MAFKKPKEKAAGNVGTALVKLEAGGAKLAPWMEEVQDEAKADAAKFQQGMPRLSFKATGISIDGKSVGTSIEVVVVEAVFGKSFYRERFKPGITQVPVCYAFHVDSPAAMVPHPEAPDKQNGNCLGCPHNKFHTALEGKGKRCKDEVRIMCVVSDLDPESILAAEARVGTVPPSSLKAWGQYVQKLRDYGQTFRTVKTKITVVPVESYFKLEFTALGGLSEPLYKAIKSKREGAADQMMQPWPALEEAAAPEPAKQGRTGKKARA